MKFLYDYGLRSQDSAFSLPSFSSFAHLSEPFFPSILTILQSELSFLFLTNTALQRQNAENLKQIFPEKEYRGLSPNFHIQVSVSELYIPTLGLPFLLEEICGPILGIYKSLTDT
jgi:hypothetical protein